MRLENFAKILWKREQVPFEAFNLQPVPLVVEKGRKRVVADDSQFAGFHEYDGEVTLLEESWVVFREEVVESIEGAMDAASAASELDMVRISPATDVLIGMWFSKRVFFRGD